MTALSIVFSSLAVRAEEGASSTKDKAARQSPPQDAFEKALTDLQAFNLRADNAKSAGSDPGIALDAAEKNLGVAESTTVEHIRGGRTSLDDHAARLAAAERFIGFATTPGGGAKPAAMQAVQAAESRLAAATEAGHLLAARVYFETISGYDPLKAGIDAGTSRMLGNAAQRVKDEVAAITSPALRSEGENTLSLEVEKPLVGAHLAAASAAYNGLKYKTLGYGSAPVMLSCASGMQKDNLLRRVRDLETAVEDNLKQARFPLVFLGGGVPDSISQEDAERAARAEFKGFGEALRAEIRGVKPCPAPPASAP